MRAWLSFFEGTTKHPIEASEQPCCDKSCDSFLASEVTKETTTHHQPAPTSETDIL